MIILTENVSASDFNELWKSIGAASWYGGLLISILGLIVIVLFFAFISGKLPSLFDMLFKKAKSKNTEIDSENWLSSAISKKHIMPASISFTKKDIEFQIKKYEIDIDRLRNQPVSGKEFIIDFSATRYISSDCVLAFLKFAKNGMDKNIVKLVFIFSNKQQKDMKKFKDQCNSLAKKYNNPSFVIRGI